MERTIIRENEDEDLVDIASTTILEELNDSDICEIYPSTSPTDSKIRLVGRYNSGSNVLFPSEYYPYLSNSNLKEKKRLVLQWGYSSTEITHSIYLDDLFSNSILPPTTTGEILCKYFAKKKVDQLANNADSKEGERIIRDRIITIGQEYKIDTSYTSFLVLETLGKNLSFYHLLPSEES